VSKRRGASVQGPASTAEILACIRAIPPGRVMSYGDVAACAGSRSPRQVGNLLATTSHAVPWHRVVRSDGKLVSPSHQLQRQLLSAEGVQFRGSRVDMRVYRNNR
jgi:methylated-DNA-protein-cysteine methyltransferase-like protein